MVEKGLDAVRLNFSHATHAQGQVLMSRIDRLRSRGGKRLLVLGDLEGHRIRIGKLKEAKPLNLKKGKIFWLIQDRQFRGRADAVSFDYEGPITDIRRGHQVYMDDGLIALEVLSVDPLSRRLKTRILTDGELKESKGVNIPQAHLHFGGLSQKDKEDIAFAVASGMDFVAQSFVRTPEDMIRVKDEIASRHGRCGVVAKIENREGIKNIGSILDVSDGIMIARGDMGISIPLEDVPLVQKEIIALCNRKKKPVITATQMLEHMVTERIPTRAEVSDVANAVLDGTDFVMLSAETAAGKYPVEAVDMMNKVIVGAERWGKCRKS